MPDPTHLSPLISLLNLLAGVVICLYLCRAIRSLPNLREAQIRTAEATLAGFGFILAGTLLKTLTVQSWDQILMFLAILLLRTLIKTAFQWNLRRLATPVTEN